MAKRGNMPETAVVPRQRGKTISILTLTAFGGLVLGFTGCGNVVDGPKGSASTTAAAASTTTACAITGRSTAGSSGRLPSFAESLLDQVRALPGVAAAVGGVAAEANLVKDGRVITFGGAPHLGFSIDPSQPQFNSLRLVDGSWPEADEVVIDRSTAHKKDINVGDQIRIEAQGSARSFTVSGLVKFGSGNLDIGGATLAGFDLPTAQKLFRKESKLDQIRVSAKPGVTKAALCSQIQAILPSHTQVRRGR